MSDPDPIADARLTALREHPLARALVAAAAPGRAWAVGGAVRDALLDRPVADFDAVVERRAAEIAAELERTLPAKLVRVGGDRFAAFRLVAGAGTLDLWDLAGGALAADLERRDFTINALALDLLTGDLFDPLAGRRDLAGRCLRASRPAVFAEDPLRVLRLARLAVALPDFALEPATLVASRAAARGVAAVAGERIRQELLRLWPAATYAAAQDALAASGAWPELWRDAGPEPQRAETARARAGLLDELLGRPEADADQRLAPTSPFSDGRMATGHALAAVTAGGAAAEAGLAALARRAVLSRDELRLACRMVECAREPPPTHDGDLAWFLHRAVPRPASAVALAAALADGEARDAWRLAAGRAGGLLAARGAEILAPRRLLDGGELQALTGLSPGPALGAVVRRLLEAQVRGEVRDVESARELARRAARTATNDQRPPLEMRR